MVVVKIRIMIVRVNSANIEKSVRIIIGDERLSLTTEKDNNHNNGNDNSSTNNINK